ncbi:vascular cell adhesion protein 1-like [Aulostomus maculatus]
MILFFVFGGLIASAAGKVVGAACPLVLIPPQVVVRYGDSFSVNCSSLTNQSEGIGWESSSHGTGLIKRATTLPFVINPVNKWNYDPECFINLLNGDQCSVELPATVYKMPDSVSLSPSSPMGPMVEGEEYQMTCDIVNVAPARNLTVSWLIGQKVVHIQTFHDASSSPVNVSSVLLLPAHRDHHGGKICCQAGLNFEPPELKPLMMSSQPRVLTVHYPPTFSGPEEELLTLPPGGKISLNCTASGNPLPVHKWHLSHAIQIETETLQGNQPILTPSFPLPGTYSCTASNTEGVSTKYFIVTKAPRHSPTLAAILGVFVSLGALGAIVGLFLVTPDGTFSLSKGSYLRGQPTAGAINMSAAQHLSGDGCSLILKPSRVVVGFGEPVTVSCEAARPVRVLGWESSINAAHTQQDLSVQWKVDSLIDWIEEPICYGVFFTVPRQCEEKLNLVLYKTPDSVTIRTVNHTGPMVEGKEYQLLCEVQNIAPVQYLSLRWYRGHTEVYNHSFSDLTSSSPVQVSSILMITPTKADNGAQYRCVAELELGPEGPQPPPTLASEPLNASVYFPPTFLSPEPETVDLIEGSETSLNCTATGNPTPVYSWHSLHLTQERTEDEAVLTSSSLLPGTYACTASNTLEKKTKQFVVKAKSKGRGEM